MLCDGPETRPLDSALTKIPGQTCPCERSADELGGARDKWGLARSIAPAGIRRQESPRCFLRTGTVLCRQPLMIYRCAWIAAQIRYGTGDVPSQHQPRMSARRGYQRGQGGLTSWPGRHSLQTEDSVWSLRPLGRADLHQTLDRIGIAYHCPIPPSLRQPRIFTQPVGLSNTESCQRRQAGLASWPGRHCLVTPHLGALFVGRQGRGQYLEPHATEPYWSPSTLGMIGIACHCPIPLRRWACLGPLPYYPRSSGRPWL